jgi:two-component system response regulator MprA
MTASMGQVLIIEDAEDLARLIAALLKRHGYAVSLEGDGLKGLAAARTGNPDLIILDRMLPGLDGLEVCRRIRQFSEAPILMLTAKGEVADRIEGLTVGATDYVPKPFDPDELVARVQAQLRFKVKPKAEVFTWADLRLNAETREVSRGDQALSLTRKEFDLLQTLMEHAPRVTRREHLLERVWGYDFEGEDNVLDVYIRHLRNKIEREGSPKLLHTVRGVGYVLKDS